MGGRKNEKEKTEKRVLLAALEKAGRKKKGGEGENREMQEGKWMNLGKVKLHKTITK